MYELHNYLLTDRNCDAFITLCMCTLISQVCLSPQQWCILYWLHTHLLILSDLSPLIFPGC